MKKIITLILVAVMLMSMMAVGAGAAEATSTNPAKILDQEFYAKSIVSFEEEGISDNFAPNTGSDKCDMTLEDGVGVSGKALKFVPTSERNWLQGHVSFGETDVSAFDGILYYIDLSGVVLDPNMVAKGQPNNTSFRLFSNFATSYTWVRNTDQPYIENWSPTVYYLAEGASEWKMCDPTAQNGCTSALPAQFKGWVYAPFSTYISRKGPEGSPVAGFYGAEGFAKILILVGGFTAKSETSVIIDEIQVVKLGTTVDPNAPATSETETPTEPPQSSEVQSSNVQSSEIQTTTNSDNTTKTTEPATTTPAEKKGCGSSITVASVAVVMTAVLGSALVIKKKKK